MNRGTRDTHSAEAGAVPSSGDSTDLASAVAVLAGVSLTDADADTALEVVLAARHAAAAALAVEADALARLAETYPECGMSGRDALHRAVVFELMAAMGCAQLSAANRLALGESLAALPALGAALRAGALDVPAGLMLLEKITALPTHELRTEALSRLLAAHAAVDGGLTRPQLSRLTGRVVAALDPGRVEERQRDAVRDRRVWHQPAPSAGEEATLGMTGPAERVALCEQSIDALARAILRTARAAARAEGSTDDGHAGREHAGERVTLDQARFDALDWLITGRPVAAHPAWPDSTAEGTADGVSALRVPDDRGLDDCGPPDKGVWEDRGPGHCGPDEGVREDGGPGNGDPDSTASSGPTATGAAATGTPAPAAREGCGCGRPRVSVTAQVTMSLTTLLGLDDAPADLAGHGQVPASVARELAASATLWRRFLTDPVDGHLVTQAIRSYRPSAAMAAFVLARAGGVCASRGCSARRDLQLDHDDPWPHGPTSATNTTPLHQTHHQGKTCGAWCHHLDPDTGALTQTSPLGRTYTTRALPPLGGTPAASPRTGTAEDRPTRSAEEPHAGADGHGRRRTGPLERHLTALLRRSPATGPPGPPPAVEVRSWRHARRGG